MGPAGGSRERPLSKVTESLLKKAGYSIIYPAAMDKLCCGMPFASKGITETAAAKGP